MARPQKTIDWEDVKSRIQARSKADDICDNLNIHLNTFYVRFKEEFGCSFCEYCAKAHSTGTANILHTQYILALAGNTKMLELLGREWCGQGRVVDQKEIDSEQLKKNFDLKMSQVIDLLSDRKIEDSSNNNETKS